MANESQSRTARRKQLKDNKAKGKRKPVFKKIFMTLLTIGIILMLGVGGLFAYYISQAPPLDEAQLSDPFSSKIYDKDDNLITDVAGEERRTRVNYNDLPPQLVDSVLATEDVRFFDHFGIDFRRIGAAVLANITNGFGSEGASTITQQVVKRSYLTSNKTLERKVQEQFLAIKLDQEFSKESILEMYLNKIYYGQGAYGIVEAAETYYGKDNLNELSLPESALLAGLPQRPSGYDPYRHPDLAQKRMSTVLNLMVQHNKITEEEAEEAKQTKVEDLLVEPSDDDSPYRAFIDQVNKEINEKMDANIYEDGLNIYTTIDPDAQDYVEEMLSENSSIDWPDETLQTGIAVTDTETGAIRAIGGGRNYIKDHFNFATDIERQPGSTFKPITAYGPAIEHGKLSTYHQINDEAIDINGWTPKNYDDRFRGWVSMRHALSRSLNIPAIKTLQDTGIDKAEPFVEGLGFQLENDMVLSDAIGGGVLTNPVQMSGAYAAFGNEGVYNEPHTVRKVESSDGQTTDLKPEAQSAMSDYTAYMITSMLQSVMTDGTGTAANVSGIPDAGKTGTTNRPLEDGTSIVPDVWFSGYTSNYSVSIWTGYSDNNQNLSNISQQIPKQIYKSVMGHISEGEETADFNKPDSVEWIGIESGSRPGKLPSNYTPESQIVSELFHVDNKPTETSEQFEKLNPVQGLTASYNEETEAIDLEWEYGDTDNITFKVSVATDGGQARELTTTNSMGMEVSQIQPGSSYQFTVIAVSNNGDAEESNPATTTVEIPGGEDEEQEEQEEGSEDDSDSEEEGDESEGNENNGEGNGNDNGNGNGNGNGNNGNENNNGNNEDGEAPTGEEPSEEDETSEEESGGGEGTPDSDTSGDSPENNDEGSQDEE
ncbi:PBP1A family penicillin-binding protein [Halobacillus seohaensis]|uniref:PBP1A family penicillin-binding protein n=1 Tax=Halobacillus seohaensis TaxID=447421 RepID=A0ABW2EDN0_9BACI